MKLASYWWESVGSGCAGVVGFAVSAGTMRWDSKRFSHWVHRPLHVRQYLGKDGIALLLPGTQSKMIKKHVILDTYKYTNLYQCLPVSGTIWVGIKFLKSCGWFFTHRNQVYISLSERQNIQIVRKRDGQKKTQHMFVLDAGVPIWLF